MKKVFTLQNIVLAGYLRSVVEEYGISCYIKNEHLSGGVGEIPAIECWPEIWVIHNRDHLPAKRLIDEVLNADSAMIPAWRCASCGEHMEGQFTDCWKCGGSRTESSAMER